MTPIVSRNGGNDSRTLHVNPGGAQPRKPDRPQEFTDRLADPALTPSTNSPDDLLTRLFAEQSRAGKPDAASLPRSARSPPRVRHVGRRVPARVQRVLLRDELGQKPDADEFVWRFPAFAAQFREQLRLRRVCTSGIRSVAMSLGGGTHVGPSIAESADQRVGSSRSSEVLPTVAGYEILSQLGKGGMGTVYKARQIGLNRIVALKMIRGGPFADPEFQARFRVEAEAVARMQHRISSIYEIAPPLRAGPGIRSSRWSSWMAATCAHLRHSQQRPVRHSSDAGPCRPLRPRARHRSPRSQAANILLMHDGTPKIADSGSPTPRQLIPADGAGPTLDGTVVGTPSMAPSDAAGRATSAGGRRLRARCHPL
jgi:hypothetical protein